MKKYTIALVSVFLACLFCRVSNTAAEEFFNDLQPQDEITGQIQALNYQTRMLLVKTYLDEARTQSREDNIYVLEDAVISREDQRLDLEQLQAGQTITVKFRIAPNGTKEAEHIWISTGP